MNTDQLTSLGLSIEDVRLALVTQNLEIPGGIVNQGSRELVLRTLGRVAKADNFNDLVIANRNGYPICIRDIGRAEDSVEEPRGLSRLDGQNAVSLYVQRQSGTNTVAISDAAQARLAKIAPSLPADIKIEIIQDQSQFIRESMREVKIHLVLAAILVASTILLFIRELADDPDRLAVIPTSIIPTSSPS